MTQLSIVVTGVKELERILRKKANKVKDAQFKALLKSAIIVEADAKKNVPVDTGRLRASITHEVKRNLVAKVGTNVEYGPFVEFGFMMDPPRQPKGTGRIPFLFPAFNKNQKRINNIIAEAIRKVMLSKT